MHMSNSVKYFGSILDWYFGLLVKIKELSFSVNVINTFPLEYGICLCQ